MLSRIAPLPELLWKYAVVAIHWQTEVTAHQISQAIMYQVVFVAEYDIRENFDTNEYPNIFLSTNLLQ